MGSIYKRAITGFAASSAAKIVKSFKTPNKNVLKAGRKGAMKGMPRVKGGRSGGF